MEWYKCTYGHKTNPDNFQYDLQAESPHEAAVAFVDQDEEYMRSLGEGIMSGAGNYNWWRHVSVMDSEGEVSHETVYVEVNLHIT